MSSSRGVATPLAVALLFGSMATHPANAEIRCPTTRNGGPLKGVALFDGPPSAEAELLPEDGRFVVPQEPRSLGHRFPNSTLDCTYRGSKEVVAVVLPPRIRVCDSTNGPQVRCH
jgi:hypothetical protein